jgi:hypothetical protein
LLIEYTQAQCELHGVELKGSYPTGRFWDIENQCWRSDYAAMPVVNEKRLILVPKYSVRRTLALDAQEYYSHHNLNFIQEEALLRGSSLVRVLGNGARRPPYKKTLKEKFPFSKDFIARFSEANPEVLQSYKRFYSQIEGARGTLRNRDFDEELDESLFAQALKARLQDIELGSRAADEYHSLIVGALEFIFWPRSQEGDAYS